MTTRLLCLLATRDEAEAYARRKYFGQEIATVEPCAIMAQQQHAGEEIQVAQMNLTSGLCIREGIGGLEIASTAPLLGPEEDHQKLDRFEDMLLDRQGAEPGCVVPLHMPVKHTFTPYLYSREIFMQGPRPGLSGAQLTSRCHLTDHQFAVLQGVVKVFIPGEEPTLLRAGHAGVTLAGTRRAIEILEDCRWITYHPMTAAEEERRAAGASAAELVAMIEARIIGKRDRPDGRDVFAEYKERLDAAALPGPHDGPRALEEGS